MATQRALVFAREKTIENKP